MAAATEIAVNKQYGGYNRRYRHTSAVLGCDMTFTIYFPPTADSAKVRFTHPWLPMLIAAG